MTYNMRRRQIGVLMVGLTVSLFFSLKGSISTSQKLRGWQGDSSSPTFLKKANVNSDVTNFATNDNSSVYQRASDMDSAWRPSLDWIENCVSEAKRDTSYMKPFRVVWRRYVLGDCIKLCRNCYIKKCVVHPETTRQRGSGCFEKTASNTTFAALYHFRACKPHQHVLAGNLTIVEEILQEAQHWSRPNPTDLVIHLRLGDVIENSNATVVRMLWKGADPWHTAVFRSAIKSIGEYLTDLETVAHKFSRIFIRGGSHDPNYYKKSRVYARCLHHALERAGYAVQLRSEGSTPDEDFYFMAHASYLIVSAGGFSRLMGTLAKRNGGQVIGREFYIPPTWLSTHQQSQHVGGGTNESSMVNELLFS